MIVADASAVLGSLIAGEEGERLVPRIASEELAAPEVVDLEVHHALRRMVLRDELRAEESEAVRAEYLALSIERYTHEPLLDRVWGLRASLSAYDAAYVALAEALDVPLVTTDRRLARSRGHGATIELY